jgi:hypothetical protein
MVERPRPVTKMSNIFYFPKNATGWECEGFLGLSGRPTAIAESKAIADATR